MNISEIHNALKSDSLNLSETDKTKSVVIIISENDDVKALVTGEKHHLLATMTEQIINNKQFRELIIQSIGLAAKKSPITYIELELMTFGLRNDSSEKQLTNRCWPIIRRIAEQIEENNPTGSAEIVDEADFNFITTYFPKLITGEDYINITSRCFDVERILRSKGYAYDEDEKEGFLYRYILTDYLYLMSSDMDAEPVIKDALADFVQCDDSWWFCSFAEILEHGFREKVLKKYNINSLSMSAGLAILKSLEETLCEEVSM